MLHQYSEVLVQKLEAKNTELKEALESLRLAHDEIVELNRDLEQRVHERTAQLACGGARPDHLGPWVAIVLCYMGAVRLRMRGAIRPTSSALTQTIPR